VRRYRAQVPRLLVIQPHDSCPVDRFGTWLEQAGVRLETCRPYAGEPVPERVTQDGLLVLGGRMGANDDAELAWLGPVKALMRRAVEDRVPTLGICLGAQLLAAACGGRVEVGSGGIEAGVVDVQWRPEAAADPLVGGLPGPFAGPSMHLDAVVELPTGATWLGQTSAYPHQAFRVGTAAWGVQFHPEVSLATYRTWADHHEGDWQRWQLDGAEVVDQLVRRSDDVARGAQALATRFAGLLREHAAA
jgi:GMP synthase (glutamine-hydrolysing)